MELLLAVNLKELAGVRSPLRTSGFTPCGTKYFRPLKAHYLVGLFLLQLQPVRELLLEFILSGTRRRRKQLQAQLCSGKFCAQHFARL